MVDGQVPEVPWVPYTTGTWHPIPRDPYKPNISRIPSIVRTEQAPSVRRQAIFSRFHFIRCRFWRGSRTRNAPLWFGPHTHETLETRWAGQMLRAQYIQYSVRTHADMIVVSGTVRTQVVLFLQQTSRFSKRNKRASQPAQRTHKSKRPRATQRHIARAPHVHHNTYIVYSRLPE